MNRRLGVRMVLMAALAIHAFASSTLGYASVAGEHQSAPMQQCPCCPDDPGAMSGCLSLCGAHALAGAMLPTAIAAPACSVEIPFTPVARPTQITPPPDPPPIR